MRAKSAFPSRNLVRKLDDKHYTAFMSYLTLEVEIDHGKVTSKEPSKLPDKGSGLLTIFQSETTEAPNLNPLQALESLQNHLELDAGKAAEWMTAVREARH